MNRRESATLIQGVALAIVLASAVVGLLAFAEANSPAGDDHCFRLIAKSQFPKWVGCAMATREGLAAGLIGAAGALFAGWLAFASIQRQIDETRNARQRAAQRAKIAAVMAITHPVHAAAMTLKSVRRAIVAKTPADIASTDMLVKRGVGYLESALKNFILREVGRDLDGDDSTIFISIVSTMSTMVDISKTQNVPRAGTLRRMKRGLDNVHTYLKGFDQELADIFEEGAKP
jgi:hypothetical protein